MTGCSSGCQLGCSDRNSLRCACANSARLGSDDGDSSGDDGLYGNDERHGICGCSEFSEGRLGCGVDGCQSENDGWTVGLRTAARKVGGSALLARMSFDKDNPAKEREGWRMKVEMQESNKFA